MLHKIEQSQYFLNRKFQASSLLIWLWLYSSFVVDMVGNPEYRFSRETAHIMKTGIMIQFAFNTDSYTSIVFSSEKVNSNTKAYYNHMSLVMRKQGFCICENKDADQLRGNREADQHLCFATRVVKSLFFLNAKLQACSQPSSVIVQPSLCQNCSESLKTGFLVSRIIFCINIADPD